jgi:hypothetical protein
MKACVPAERGPLVQRLAGSGGYALDVPGIRSPLGRRIRTARPCHCIQISDSVSQLLAVQPGMIAAEPENLPFWRVDAA